MEIKYPPVHIAPMPPWAKPDCTWLQARSYAESTVKINPHVYLSTQELYIEQEGQDPRIVSRKDLMHALALLDATRPQPEPFDLERAKAGDPIITRGGRKARFVGHVPEAMEDSRVLVMIEGEGVPWIYPEIGEHSPPEIHPDDLLMAPQQKPQPAPMWAARHAPVGPYDQTGSIFSSEEVARRFARESYSLPGLRVVEVKEC